MATISKEKWFLKNVGEWMKVVTYSGGVFKIKLPDVVVEDLCLPDTHRIVEGASESEVNSKFKELIKEWENNQTKKEKVILFKVLFNGGLLREEVSKIRNETSEYVPEYGRMHIYGDKSTHYFLKSDLDGINGSGLGLLIKWSVYEKSTFKNNSTYKFISGRPLDHFDISHRLDTQIVEIPYSKVREKFFLELDESFARMIAKVYAAIGDLTADKLIKLSESKIKLLQ